MSIRRISSSIFKHWSRQAPGLSDLFTTDKIEERLEQKAETLLVHGYKLDQKGMPDAADTIYQQTIQYLEIYQAEQNHRVTSFTIGRIALRHGIHLYRLHRLAEARAAFNEAVLRFESMVTYDASLHTIDRLATSLRWLANTKRLMGDLQKARTTYLRAIALYRQLIAFTVKQPVNLVYDRLMHSANIGLGKTIRQQRELTKQKKRLAT